MGKLFLASQDFGKHVDVLLGWLPNEPKVALIMNAADYHDEETRILRTKDKMKMMSEVGFSPTEIDLREYLGKKEELEKELRKYDLVWVRGGNTFILNWIFRESGFNSVIKKLLDENAIVYGGESAGLCIMTSTIREIGLIDDPELAEERIDEGLGYHNGLVIPHWPNAKEDLRYQNALKYIKKNKIDHITLSDDDVIVIEDGDERILR